MVACDHAMLEICGLTRRYGDVVAIDGVTLRVAAGEVVGFLGPNGAGKTTTMRILAGALPATAGRARVAGHCVREQPLAARRALGYLPEVPPLYADLTADEQLRFVGRLRGLRGHDLAQEVARVRRRVDLDAVGRRLVRALSKGTQQRLGLAQALLGRPPVLILDEPTVGLDPRQVAQVRALIADLGGEHTVLWSTHMLQEVVSSCSRVVVISRGRLVADDSLAGLVARHGHRPGAPAPASLEQIFLALTAAA